MLNPANAFILAFALLASSAAADSTTTTNGGDSFTAGSTVTQTYDASGDVFVTGEVITIGGQSAGDVHVAGMDLDVATDTSADLYAAGATVTISANVAEDVTAMAYSIRLSSNATIGHNARLLGRAIVVDGPVAGALTATAGEVTLNSVVQGDALITAKTITFGPNAQIMGQLVYISEDEFDIPERVIPGDRVRFQKWTRGPMWDEMRRTWDEVEMPMLPSFISAFSVFVIGLAFLILIGSIFLSFAPQPIARMRRDIVDRPGRVFLLGVLGLSVLFGLVPIAALTIIGIPFAPFGILLIILAWTLGYLLAAYAIAMRGMVLLGGPRDPSLLIRLLVLAAAVCIVTLLNFIPFVGWVINYTLVLLGVGAMTSALFTQLTGSGKIAPDADMKTIEPE